MLHKVIRGMRLPGFSCDQYEHKPPMFHELRRSGVLVSRSWFHVGGGLFLLITGGAKLVTVASRSRVLSLPDPIFGIPFEWLFLSVGLLEVTIGGVCLLSRRAPLTALLIAWLSTSFLAYRVGLWLIGWQGPCRCLGSLTDGLKLPPIAAERIAWSILAFLVIGSYSQLGKMWMERAKRDDCASVRTVSSDSS